MPVEFHDYSIEAKDALDETALLFLEKACMSVTAQVQQITPVGDGQLKGSWRYEIDRSQKVGTVGSPLENAIWTELGTGEYALEGKGRKGGWYIPIGNGKGQISEATVKKYHMMVVYGKNGKKFAFTKGKKPVRMLLKSFQAKKSSIINLSKQLFKERMD